MYAVLVTQLRLTLCSSMDCSPLGSSVHGIQARILKWVAISFSRGSSLPRDQTQVSHTAGRLFTIWATRGSWCFPCMYVCIYIFFFRFFSIIGYYKILNVVPCTLQYVVVLACSVTQLCLNLCNTMHCSPPGSAVHGIFQARKMGCHFPLQGIFLT